MTQNPKPNQGRNPKLVLWIIYIYLAGIYDLSSRMLGSLSTYDDGLFLTGRTTLDNLRDGVRPVKKLNVDWSCQVNCVCHMGLVALRFIAQFCGLIKIVFQELMFFLPFFLHIALISQSQMALLGFFCDSLLLPPPWWVVKHAKAHAIKHCERVREHAVRKERKREGRRESEQKNNFAMVGIWTHRYCLQSWLH